MTVDAAWEFFADEPHVRRSLIMLREVDLGYLRLGQPATARHACDRRQHG